MYLPRFHITARITKLIEEISSLKERIIGAKIGVPWIPKLQKESMLKNAMGSTAIEGFILTMPEITKLESEKYISAELSIKERAGLNYISALRYIYKNPNKEKLTKQDLFHIHRIITQNASEGGPVGEYKKEKNYVVSGSGAILYTPPGPEKTDELVNGLLCWINKESGSYIPVISSGVMHYELTRIHPFSDGNGRVARLMGTWELLRKRFDTLHMFAIDDIIYEHKKAYYSVLRLTDKGCELTEWLEFYMETVAESLERAWDRINKLPYSSMLKKIVLSRTQEKIVRMLTKERMKSKEVAAAIGITTQGIHLAFKVLIEAKIIKKYGTKKSGKYGIIKHKQ